MSCVNDVVSDDTDGTFVTCSTNKETASSSFRLRLFVCVAHDGVDEYWCRVVGDVVALGVLHSPHKSVLSVIATSV